MCFSARPSAALLSRDTTTADVFADFHRVAEALLEKHRYRLLFDQTLRSSAQPGKTLTLDVDVETKEMRRFSSKQMLDSTLKGSRTPPEGIQLI